VHELLTATGWRGAGLVELVRRALRPHAGEERYGRLRLAVGEDLPLRAGAAQNLVLALHELATNAAKYGGWSVPTGRVELDLRLVPDRDGNGDGRALELVWRETGGPEVRPPGGRGFGTTLLDRVVAGQHGGRTSLDWRPGGLVYRLTLPEAEIREGGEAGPGY
jgi:two-component sensor histidine kinase